MMALLWSLGAMAAAGMFAGLAAHGDAPLAAGLMIGATFYLAGFTALLLHHALSVILARAVAKSFFIALGAIAGVLGGVSLAASLAITAVKTYAKYFS